MSLGQLKDALQAQGALFRDALVNQSHSNFWAHWNDFNVYRFTVNVLKAFSTGSFVVGYKLQPINTQTQRNSDICWSCAGISIISKYPTKGNLAQNARPTDEWPCSSTQLVGFICHPKIPEEQLVSE